MKKACCILMVFLVFPVLLSCVKQVKGEQRVNNESYRKISEQSSEIAKEQALAIAEKDASAVYRDISLYKVKTELKQNNWYIDYDLINQELQGGGPHYIISGSTGEIISKRYEQ
ncbi:hypothetical protein Cylst_3390 [Cylindrospermum stagnale PCC 7417]|uniref:Peptidase propeptide domain-containing protein n=1 Tax=Cylindrospermum stagnale PCC 7417 TaxID=56107 RepID=K9WYU4_9NOST|nr:hypothetical protein [Cylindrospermum stagnale]AFZ25540.1 hypothetical protein Cylst_3390 [Cylindrospermum stagnale PCC 7417]